MKKKILVSVFLILGIIIATIGLTYAFLSYSKTGATINKIKSGNITFNYKEISRGVSIENAMPMTDEQGKRQANYFDFTIKSKTSDTLDIPYYITVNRSGDNLDGIVKLYLTKVDDNNKESEVVLKPFSTLGTYTHNSINIPVSEKLLYTDKVFAGDDNYEQKYRLRMWIDINASYIDQTGGVDTYPLQDKTYSIKVNVYSNGEIATHEQIALRENVNISNIEEGINILTTSTSTFIADETITPGEETLTKTLTINTENPNSTVTVTKRTATNTNIKRLTSSHQVELTYGTNTFDIVVTSENRKETKNYTLVIEVEYPSYEVTIVGSNITATSPTLVKYNQNKSTTITVASGYYLSGVSCTNGYTIDTTTGNSAQGTRSITIKNNGNQGNSTCTFTTETAVPIVTMQGSNITFENDSIQVAYNSYNTVTVTPSSNYYLSSVSCTNGYTNNATTGISATEQQTVRITNPGTYSNSKCTFTVKKYYTTSSQIANAFSSSKNVIACDISGEKYYNCSGYSTLQAAFDSRTTGHVVFKNNLSTSAATELVSGKTFTLDLNGKNLTNNSTDSPQGIMNYGNLTINNSTSTIGGINSYGAAVKNDSTSAILVINNGKFSSSNIAAPTINSMHGTVTINSGTYTNASSNTAGIVSSSCSTCTTRDSTLIINGGTFISNSTAAQPATVINFGDTINAITINGGTFTNTGNGMVVDNYTNRTININGGTFIANNNYAIFNGFTGTININQTSSKGPIYIKSSIFGIENESSGTINITASRANNCTATQSNTTTGLCVCSVNKAPIRNYASGTVKVNGGTYYSINAGGLNNNSNGKVYVKNSFIISSSVTAFNHTSGKGEIYVCSSTIDAGTAHFANRYTGDLIKYYNITFQGVSSSMIVESGNKGTITKVTSCPW